MAWTTPKINWATDDVIGVDDLNEIGNNLQYLYDRGGAGVTFGAALIVASGNRLLPSAPPDSIFHVTNGGIVYYIDTTGRSAGDRVTFINDYSSLIFSRIGTTVGTKVKINLGGPLSSITIVQYSVASFIYDGTVWYFEGDWQ